MLILFFYLLVGLKINRGYSVLVDEGYFSLKVLVSRIKYFVIYYFN